MTFGQQPQPNPNYEPQGNNTLNTGYGAPQYQYAGQQNTNYINYNQQMPPQYGQPQYAYAGQGGAAATVDGQVAYSYEQAERVSVTKAYGEMTIGLVVTA